MNRKEQMKKGNMPLRAGKEGKGESGKFNKRRYNSNGGVDAGGKSGYK
jgi:hypothetical protein